MLGTGPRDFPTHWKQTILLLLGDGGQALEEDEVGQIVFLAHFLLGCWLAAWHGAECSQPPAVFSFA